MEYDPKGYYKFTGEDGSSFYSAGDNGYVWESMTNGVPISINEKGDWYVHPYIDVTPENVVVHMPDWFKNTPEYKDWQSISTLIYPGINKSRFDEINDSLDKLGKMGVLRVGLANEAKKYGITDEALQSGYRDAIVGLASENKINNPDDYAPGKFHAFDKDYESIAEFAREFSAMDKERQSSVMTELYGRLQNAEGKTGLAYDEQKKIYDALVGAAILNAVDDNYEAYGNDNEFEGLLQASGQQKFNSFIVSWIGGMSNSFLGVIPRAVRGSLYGVATLLGKSDKGFDTRIEDDVEADLKSAAYGYSLEGQQEAITAGSYAGTATSVLAMIGLAMATGGVKQDVVTKAGLTSANFTASLVTFSKQFLGSCIIADFAFTDVPLDILNFFTAWSQKGSIAKAFWDSSETQPFLPIPFSDKIPILKDINPQVPQGFVMDLAGDITLDAGTFLIGGLANYTADVVDEATGGWVTRVREGAAIQGFKMQEKFRNIPVIGTGWSKLMDAIWSPQHNALIVHAKKDSIAQGTTDPYIRMQNLITMKNQGGASAVAAEMEIKKIEMNYQKRVKDFQKNASKYGGMQKTQTKWTEPTPGKAKLGSRTVPDILPKQVRDGVIEYQRLYELKGQAQKEGGLISNPKRDAEIQKLEAKVEAMPDEIKKFAEDWANLNKSVEDLAVKLGVRNEDWLKAMRADPEFQKYMVRQTLPPDGEKRVGSPDNQKILNAPKKVGTDFDVNKYIDPVIALDMKIEALGRAYAYNLLAEHVAAMEIAGGRVIAGTVGAAAASKAAELKQKIKNADTLREKIGYNKALKKIQKESSAISESLDKMNSIINLPGRIIEASSYSAAKPKEITDFVKKFENGEIRFAPNARSDAKLSDGDADFVIRNTYTIKSDTGKGSNCAADNANVVEEATKGSDKYAGVAPDGTPFEYEVKDGVVTKFKEVKTDAGYSEAISKICGIHIAEPKEIHAMGHETAKGLMVSIIWVRDTMPALPKGYKLLNFRKRPTKYGVTTGHNLAFSDKEYNLRLNADGKIEADYNIGLNTYVYHDGNEATAKKMATDSATKKPGQTGKPWHPENSGGTLSSTAIHETGHSIMAQLCVERLNERIAAGKINTSGWTTNDVINAVWYEWLDIGEEFVKKAFDRIGIKYTEAGFQKKWAEQSRKDISGYAGSEKKQRGSVHGVYKWETFSEALVDYWANGSSASEFTKAIVEIMREECTKYGMARSPRTALVENGLEAPKNMFKGNDYNFPDSVKTREQKAKWLNKKRKENPYLKKDGKFTDDDYIKANKWDNFFKKEINTYDASFKTESPEILIRKSGDYIEALKKKTATDLTAAIKEISGKGFNEDLASMVMSSNPKDVGEALNNFIVGKMNERAKEIASNMEGGATEENLNIARITLYSDSDVAEEISSIVRSFTPGLTDDDVDGWVNTLIDTQVSGLEAYEKMPVETKALNAEYNKELAKLKKANNAALKVGKKTDATLRANGWTDDATQVIHYVKNGEDVYIVVNDPLTAAMLKNPNDYKRNGNVSEAFFTAANIIAKRYRLGTTGISAVSLIKNMLRDPVQAWKTAGANPLTMTISPQAFYSTLRMYGLDDATIREVTQKIHDWATSGTMTATIKRYGGATPQTIGYRNNVERFEKWYNNHVLEGKLYSAAGAPLEMWESAFRTSVGQQAFIKALKRNGGDIDKAMQRAMFDTSNATTNFSHTIYFARRLTASVPYLASGINGVASFWRLFQIDPIGVLGRISAGVIVPAMAITTWNLSSEDKRKTYLNLPEWYRNSHIVIIDPDNNVFAIPIPEEVSQFYGTARKLIEFSNDANPASIPSILVNGAFGFLPGDTDGFFDQYGNFQLKKGVQQYAMGLIPQAVMTGYEAWTEYNTFVGYSTADLEWYNKIIYNLGNVFGTSFVNIVNDIGYICGASKNFLYGKSTAEKLAQELFGMGFNEAKNQFMEMVGNKSEKDYKTGKVKKATGLFKEAEDLKAELANIDKEIATSPEDKKAELEAEKQKKIEAFGEKVKNMTNKYMQLYTISGGLEDWQRRKLIQVLNLGSSYTSAEEGSYQAASSDQASLDEYALGRKRYVELGLPSGPTVESLAQDRNGKLKRSIELQDSLDKLYGTPKQATQDIKNAIERSGLKDTKERFREAISAVYDEAEANGTDPDYDKIEKLQATYLQSVDAVLVPIINQYGSAILNDNNLINEMRSYLSGMIPSDDWKQSVRNKKKFLAKADYPLAAVDVEAWLKDRYSSSVRKRGFTSDQEVTNLLDAIASDIDSGRTGAARGKIEELKNAISSSQYYISAEDYQRLAELYNMVK